jgi:hypothetical protein
MNGHLSLDSLSTERYGNTGSTPVVSSNAGIEGTAVVWVLQRATPGAAPPPMILRAYNALNLDTLHEEEVGPWAFADTLPGYQFLYPTVADGRVYVGGDNYLAVFGLR